ncbi:protein asteroid [Trichinella spiralis]|uniref:protein asteroid n=1 Tax=Trichinella spiralis TaxID=6334 RepID=UPI0001EFC199|nr:protein asteroid [Trichinella spiralis]
MVCQIFSAHLNKGERAYLKNIPRISYKSEVDMAEEFISNEHQLQKPQKVMINSIVSTAAISQKEINGKDEAEASGDGLIDLPTIIPTTSMETVSVEPSNDDDITMSAIYELGQFPLEVVVLHQTVVDGHFNQLSTTLWKPTTPNVMAIAFVSAIDVHFNTGTIAEDEFQMTNEQQSNCDEHSKCQGDAEAHEQQQ